MTGLAALFLTLAAASSDPKALIPVPSGARVWLQETLSDKVVGMGAVQRYRFVMPALADQVPPVDVADGEDFLPGELTDADVAALNDGSFSGTPSDGAADGAEADLQEPAIRIMPPDTPAIDPGDVAQDTAMMNDMAQGGGMIPDTAFDIPVPAQPPGTEAAADADVAVPVAPDILLQDPNHKDIVWLCEHFVLPRIKDLPQRPQQIVISVASAESPFGTFDPGIVQLFEGFALPPDRDACLWEPW